MKRRCQAADSTHHHLVSQRFGQAVVAVCGTAARVDQTALLPIMGLTTTTLTLVGQNNGAVFYILAYLLGIGLTGIWWGIFLVTWSATIFTLYYVRRTMIRTFAQ